MRQISKVVGVLAVAVVLSMSLVSSTSAEPKAGNAADIVSRFGIGFSGRYSYHLSDYDLDQLKVGDLFPFSWYADWGIQSNPDPIQGMSFTQLLRVGSTHYPPNWAAIQQVAQSNPGSTWLVGNEPECWYQGNRTPQQYAEIYHEVWYRLKSYDPMAVVVVGGVVQPSPLRLKWLDEVLRLYQQTYGETMPVDGWSIHNQILYEGQQGVDWGAGIPAGITDTAGEALHITLKENASLDLFKKHVRDFRQWMKDNGYQDTPLMISEYGVLMPSSILGDGDTNRGDKMVIDFMTGSFDYMLRTVDPETGFPGDGNRLVQTWLWYSLNEEPYNNDTGQGFNGSLFVYNRPNELTVFGRAFRDYVMGLYGSKTYLPLGMKSFR